MMGTNARGARSTSARAAISACEGSMTSSRAWWCGVCSGDDLERKSQRDAQTALAFAMRMRSSAAAGAPFASSSLASRRSLCSTALSQARAPCPLLLTTVWATAARALAHAASQQR
jgi:hypothetical protein